MPDDKTKQKDPTDLDVLMHLFEKRQERLAAESVVDAAKGHLKLAKQAEADALDALNTYIPKRQFELAMPKWSGPIFNTDLTVRTDIPPWERGRSDDPPPDPPPADPE